MYPFGFQNGGNFYGNGMPPIYGGMYQQNPQSNDEDLIPDLSPEQHQANSEQAFIEALRSRVMTMLDDWQRNGGMEYKNPHLMLQTLLPTLTQLIGLSQANNRIKSDLKTKLADIKIKIKKGDSEESSRTAQDIADIVLKLHQERETAAKASQNPTIYSGAPLANFNPGFDVNLAMHHTRQREQKQRDEDERQRMGQSDPLNQQPTSTLFDPLKFSEKTRQAAEMLEQFERSVGIQTVQPAFGVTSAGEFVVYNVHDNTLLHGYAGPPARYVVEWQESEGKRYGVGDDGSWYPVV